MKGDVINMVEIASRRNKPYINVAIYQEMQYSQVVNEIKAGIEEEGVPNNLIFIGTQNGLTASDIIPQAYESARLSPLGVGIAVGKDTSVAVHEKKLPMERPLFLLSPQMGSPLSWRILGSNAARIIKVMPFKEIPDYSDIAMERLVSLVTEEVIKKLTGRKGEKVFRG